MTGLYREGLPARPTGLEPSLERAQTRKLLSGSSRPAMKGRNMQPRSSANPKRAQIGGEVRGCCAMGTYTARRCTMPN